MSDRQQGYVYLHSVDNIFKAPTFKKSLERSGFVVTEHIEMAEWAVSSFEEGIEDIVGKVPKILASTIEVRPLYGRQREVVQQGSKIWTLDLTTGDYDDLWMFFIDFGWHDPEFVPWSSRDKVKSCMMASNRRHVDKVPGDLTEVRWAFVRRGLEDRVMDLYGGGWGAYQEFSKGESRYGADGRPWPEIKHETIREYGVNFALENTYYQNYVTEKFWHAVRGGCVPVYYGSSWMDRLVNPDSYLDLRRLRSTSQVFDAIASLDEAKARDMVSQALSDMEELRRQYSDDIRTVRERWQERACRWMTDVDSFEKFSIQGLTST